MSAYTKMTKAESRKIQRLLKGKSGDLADLVLFSGGNTIDRVLVRQKSYNAVNGMKRTCLKKHPEWNGLIRVVSANKKRELDLKY